MSERESPEQPVTPAPDGAAQNPLWIALAAWLLPGSGHFLLGRRGLAIAFLVIIACSLGVGLLLDGNLYRIVPNRPLTVLATLACMGLGAPYFVLRFLLDYQGDVVGPGFEYGTAFVLTAGLMNLLLILDTLDITAGKKE